VTSSETACIGIVASDPLRLLGLMSILEETVGVRATALELEDAYTQPDIGVLVLGFRGPAEALTETIARLRRERPALKVVVMGESLAPSHVQAVIGAGAKGYLAETAGENEIKMAIDVVLDGSIWAPRKVLARLIDAGGSAAGSAMSDEPVAGKMTPREREVLHLLKEGGSNRDIALAMGIDEVTVKAHLGRMLRKTGASNRVELTLRALEEQKAEARAGRTEDPENG
jgi:DNA-binding NarL/FixJ family response regulator